MMKATIGRPLGSRVHLMTETYRDFETGGHVTWFTLIRFPYGEKSHSSPVGPRVSAGATPMR